MPTSRARTSSGPASRTSWRSASGRRSIHCRRSPRRAGAPFDFAFIDADKPGNADYFAWAVRLVRVGGLIVVDNVVREGAVIDPAGDANAQGARRLFEAMAREPRVTATAVQTVGSKKWDGFAIALVTR